MSFDITTPKGPRRIGPGNPVFIIGELSGNHNGDKKRAVQLIDAAIAAGVDAVKIQTYTPDTMTIDCDADPFQIKVNAAWSGKTLYQLYQEAYTPWEWQAELKAYAEDRGVLLFSTPFDKTSVDFLEQLNVALYKVASFETGDLELLRDIGATRKPVIISRGLTTHAELTTALAALRAAGAPDIAVLHCVSSYPALPEEMNLANIPDLATHFGVVTGLSDHTLGTTTAIAAVALGASIVEKHITLRRSDGGPDAAFSLEPEELTELVRAIRIAEQAIGTPTNDIGGKERENLVFRRSLFAVKDIAAGEPLTRENVRCIRPGHGLEPKWLPEILGRTAARDIKRGTPLNFNLISMEGV